jgi:hypothetical protein
VLDQQICFQRVGMIEVHLRTLGGRQSAQIL